MAKENSFRPHIFSAMREILMVVISILIALEVNLQMTSGRGTFDLYQTFGSRIVSLKEESLLQ